MAEIDPQDLLDWFRWCIERCTTSAENEDDEILSYNLFEQFDGPVFLHDNTLEVLLRAGLIDEEIAEKSRKVWSIWHAIGAGMGHYVTIEEIRTDPEWQALFALCDEIKRRLDLRSA